MNSHTATVENAAGYGGADGSSPAFYAPRAQRAKHSQRRSQAADAATALTEPTTVSRRPQWIPSPPEAPQMRDQGRDHRRRDLAAGANLPGADLLPRFDASQNDGAAP